MARNEYLAAENRILKVQLNGRLKLSDAERGVLGEIGHRLGRKVLAEVATVARPDTILGWYRKLLEPTSSMARIRTHLVRLAGPDFFTAEVMTLRGLVTPTTYYSSSILRAAGWISRGSPFIPMSGG